MHAAAVNGRKNFMKLFIDHKASCDMMSAEKNGHKTPLHAAVIKRQRDVANMLLEHGADVNAQMVEDVTPLHLAAASGWQDGVSLLLRFGALTDARDAFLHETALHKAARNRRMRAIEMLCKRGANEKAKNIDGQTYHSVLVCSLENPGSWNVSEEDASIFSSM
jgi:ankyrin repeat protein